MKNQVILIVVCLFLTGSVLSHGETARVHPASQMSGEYIDWMKKVADWQLTQSTWNYSVDWLCGTLHAGIMATYETTKDETYLNKSLQWAQQYNWRMGSDSRHADNHTCTQTYLELYLLEQQDPFRYQHFQSVADVMAADPRHFNCDVAAGSEVWWWCDALFMAPPAMVRLSRATGDSKYTDMMHWMWLETEDCLYDPQEHLFFRDINFFDDRVGGKKVFWSRGNGWVVGGIVRVLRFLPLDDPMRGHYETLFEDMAAKLATLQQPDGYWYSNLLYPEQFNVPETSGTGFFCYAIAWGINNGLLDSATYGPIVENAWEALKGAVQENGLLGWVQAPGASPAVSYPDRSYVYGVGAYLLAGSEMQKYAQSKQQTVIDNFETYNSTNTLKQKWQDGPVNGTGAQISLGDYGDRFAVLHYQNDISHPTSQIDRTFLSPQDWTIEGVTALSILVQGDENNTEIPIYVRLEDQLGNCGDMILKDGSVLQSTIWQEVVFDLESIPQVDLTRIIKVSLGIGTLAPAASVYGQGNVRIDTIQLFSSRCLFIHKADFDGNCKVDLADFAALASQWTEQYGETIIPDQPDPAYLWAHWPFDENSGLTASDVSGHQFNGTLAGACSWQPGAGKVGGAVRINGSTSNSSRISIPGQSLGLPVCTVSMWAQLATEQIPDTRYLFGHTTTPIFTNRIQIYMDSYNTSLDVGLGGSHAIATGLQTLPVEQWVHVAFTLDGSNYQCYVNGILKSTGQYTNLSQVNSTAHIGNNGSSSPAQAFHGLIDEVRIYNRVLSYGQIRYLAQTGPLALIENPRNTDLYLDGIIDLQDMNLFLQDWMQDNHWPQ